MYQKQRRRNEPEEKREVRQLPHRDLSYQVGNLQGIGRREEQQDSFGSVNAYDVTKIKEEGLFLIVADGMGGMTGGRESSQYAVNYFLEEFQKGKLTRNIPEYFRDMAKVANRGVLQMFGGQGGSTLIACLLYREAFWYMSIGDSYLYLLRNGSLIRINEEHNCRQQRGKELLDEGTFDRELTDHAEQATAVTSYIGTDQELEIDCFWTPLKLMEGDIILVCSDGVAGVLSEETITACLQKVDTDMICETLEYEIQKQNRRNQDNYTGIVVSCVR